MDGVEWRDHAQRSFLSLEEPITPTLSQSENNLNEIEGIGPHMGAAAEPQADRHRHHHQWSPSSPETSSAAGSHDNQARKDRGRPQLIVSDSTTSPAMFSVNASAQGIFPPHKNTRGSRLGQQIGLASHRALSASTQKTNREPLSAIRKLEAGIDADESAFAAKGGYADPLQPEYLSISSRAAQSCLPETRQMGVALDVVPTQSRERSDQCDYESPSGSDSTSFIQRALPASSAINKQHRLSRLHYKTPDSNIRNDDADRAQRLAQGSLASLNSAFRRGMPSALNDGDPLSSDSFPHKKPTGFRVSSATGFRSEDVHFEKAVEEDDRNFIGDIGSRPASARESSSASNHGAGAAPQRELFLPAIAGNTTTSRPHSPAVIASGEGPVHRQVRKMTSAQLLRSARDYLQGTTVGSPTPEDQNSDASRPVVSDAKHSTDISNSTASSALRSAPNRFGASSCSPESHIGRNVAALHQPSSFPASSEVRTLSDAEIIALGSISGQDPEGLLPPNDAPLSSKNVLTIALAKAQSAVQYDSSNSVPEAIHSYNQAVRLLQEVMQRIAPRPSSTRKTTREEERRRLKVIHDTYADRIRLLSMIYGKESEVDQPSWRHLNKHEEVKENDNDEQTTDHKDDPTMQSSITIIPEPSAHTRLSSASAIAIQQHSATPLIDPSIEAGDATPTNQAESKETLRNSSKVAGGRSDSESSFRSAGSTGLSAIQTLGGSDAGFLPHSSRILQGAHVQSGALLSLASGAGARSARSGVADNLVPPATPYFDAEPTLGFAGSTSIASERGSERVSHDLSSTPTVGNVVVTDGAEQSRPLATSASIVDGEHQGRLSPLGAGSGRPRANTISANQSGPLSQPIKTMNKSIGRALVSASVQGGSIISRRRKGSEAPPPDTIIKEASLTRDGSGDLTVPSTDTSSSSTARKRAFSQPGGRRPVLPNAFQAPPLPSFARKRSTPSLRTTAASLQAQPASLTSQGLQSSLSPSAAAQSRTFRFPSPSPSFSSGYHALPDNVAPTASPDTSPAEGSWPTNFAARLSLPVTESLFESEPRPLIETGDLFPSGLVSAQLMGVPSHHLFDVSSVKQLRNIAPPILSQEAFPEATSTDIELVDPALRPLVRSRALQTSIQVGANLTSKLRVPAHIWIVPPGVKLPSADSRVRLIELVSNGIDAVERSGNYLFSPLNHQRAGFATVQAAGFAKSLEDLDSVLVEVQNALSKKLCFVEVASASYVPSPTCSGFHSSTNANLAGSTSARKSGGGVAGFSNFSSKLTRSLDRMALNASAGKGQQDSLGTAYIEALARCLSRAMVIEIHLTALLLSSQRSGTSGSSTKPSTAISVGEEIIEAYSSIPTEIRRIVEAKLRRASEFYATVVVRCSLRDLSVLMDKSLKRAGTIIVD